jgi:prepilin-type N-terminal cleavage/methylation domain-containing protein
MNPKSFLRQAGFSLVELITAVAIVGIIAFMALPKVTAVQRDAERNLAISRAEALNMAAATMLSIQGRTQAATAWASAGDNTSKYALLRPYLGYAEASLSVFMPDGYSVNFSTSLEPLTKATLAGPDGAILY